MEVLRAWPEYFFPLCRVKEQNPTAVMFGGSDSVGILTRRTFLCGFRSLGLGKVLDIGAAKRIQQNREKLLPILRLG